MSHSELEYFVGFDWAQNHHEVAVLDRHGTIVATFQFDHSQKGWEQFREKLKNWPKLAVAIETSQGAAVEQLLAIGCTVYPVNPKSAQRYRERQVPSGNKSDPVDAWTLANALRVDGAAWRPLSPEDPLLQQLRLICRDEVTLIGQRTALVNQLRAALHEYYPIALEAFEDWTIPSSWQFIEQFPTPQVLSSSGRRKWEKFLHVHKLWRPQTVEQRLACFERATQFCGSQAVVAAKSLLAITLVKMLGALEKQLQQYRRQIEKLFEEHPDHDVFGSLPGAGAKLAPRLAAEFGTVDRTRFGSLEALQCRAGTAPINVQSGKAHRVRMRRACDKHLRHTVHLWADLSRRCSPWAQVYYQQQIAREKTHAAALRCLAKRWLKILWKMWQTHTSYDADLHMRNQLAHGSWVIQLMQSTTPSGGE
jgi:transposase